jgi:hypothetical protein
VRYRSFVWFKAKSVAVWEAEVALDVVDVVETGGFEVLIYHTRIVVGSIEVLALHKPALEFRNLKPAESSTLLPLLLLGYDAT